MPFTAHDERELLLPLVEGLAERPLWQTFLQRLLARTGADRICLMLRAASAAPGRPIERHLAALPGLPVPDMTRLNELGIMPRTVLRVGRVYALEEMLDLDNAEVRARQQAVLGEREIAHARFIRMASGEHNAWLVLMHRRRDFGAADSALLSALAPLIAGSLPALAEMDSLALRTAMAEQALSLVGTSQTALDRDGRILTLDPAIARHIDPEAQGRLAPGHRAIQPVAEACTALDRQPQGTRRLIRLDGPEASEVLLRPAPAPALPLALTQPAAAVATMRRSRREDPVEAARILMDLLGLSRREAALAIALSRGRSILEAGHELRLTAETTRNYTKRIYAKTGASGQADLVRMVLTGLAVFA